MVKMAKTADSTSDAKIQASLEKVRADKKAAVAAEDFEKALELKRREEELLSKLRPALESELEKVRAEKQKAIASEDFKKALEVKQREQELLTQLGQTPEGTNQTAKEEKPNAQPSAQITIGCQVRILDGEHTGTEAKAVEYKGGWWQLHLTNGVKTSLRAKSLEKIQVTSSRPAAKSSSDSVDTAVKKKASPQTATASSETADAAAKKKAGRPKSTKAATTANSATESPEGTAAEASAIKKKSGPQVGRTALSLKKKQSEEKASGKAAQVESGPSSKKARTDSRSGVKESVASAPTPCSAAAGSKFNSLFKPGRKQADGASDSQSSEPAANVPVCTPEKSLRPSADQNPPSSLKERSSQAQKSMASVSKEVKESRKEDAAMEDQGADEAEVVDAYQLAGRILSELFPVLDRASFNAPEDDAEILPASSSSDKFKKRARRTAAEAEDGEDEKMEEREQEEEGRASEEALQAEEREREERQALKAAFAAVENAPNEDFDRFPMVAASFKLYLQGTVKLEDKEADERIKVFYELFQQDGKSIEAMASETYARLVKNTNRPMEEETVDLFKRCWSQISNGPFAEAQPREERGQEHRLRVSLGIPRDWGVRIWQRAHLEDLVIITSPDGAKIFEVASKVQDLDIVKEEGGLFAKERERLSHLKADELLRKNTSLSRQLEKAREDQAAQQALERAKEAFTEKLACLSESSDTPTTEAGEKKVLPVLHRLVCSCSSCGRAPFHLEQGIAEDCEGDAQDEAKPAVWNSFDDMPDATEEEKEQYPFILASFHYAGFEYVTGLRKLMELHKKKPMDMATAGYKRLVARDPENAQCNGFLNSAVLYFIKFREEGGFDKIMDQSEFAALKENEQARFTPDFDRGTLYEQVGWDDLQIEIPLERMMVDATEAWHKELLEKLTCDRFITEDIDASGYQAKAFSISLLPDATPEEWQRWPRILAKFERTMKEQSAESTGVKREQEASNLFLALKDLVEEHGKGPATMAHKRYVRIVQNIYGQRSNSRRTDAAASFAEFWDEHKDSEFPEPKVHGSWTFGKDKYTVVEQERVEAAKKVADEWDLPMGWAVKLRKDGDVLKVCGPGKDEFYYKLEDARTKAIEKAKKQAEEVQKEYERVEAIKDKRIHLTAREVGDQEPPDEAMGEAEDSLAEAEAARELALSLRSRPGRMPKLDRRTAARGEKPKIDRTGGKGGGGKGAKRKAGDLTGSEKLMQVPLKVRKSQGLGRLQTFQAAACELILKAFEWRVVGIRVGTEIRPFDTEGLDELPKSEVRLVLAYVFEDVRQQKIRNVVESWNLDENYKVTLRVRLSGDQVTVYRLSDGKSFSNLTQLLNAPPCEITLQKERLEVADMMQRLIAFLRIARQETIWELDAGADSCFSGYYRKTDTGFERVWAEKCDDSGMSICIRRAPVDDAWELVGEDGQCVLARIPGGGSDPICEGTRLELCSQGAKADSQDTALKGMTIGFDKLLKRVISEVTASRSVPCRCGRSRATALTNRSGRGPGYQSGSYQSFQMRVQARHQAWEERLEELAGRREAAPRTLPDIVDHMLCKLPAVLSIEDGSIPAIFHHSKTLRIGTMCSGTDSPVLVARSLQRALDPRGSGLKFEHVFSVEIDPAKQEFLRANFPECPHIFQDVTQMGRAKAFDTLTQSPQPVPGNLDLLIAGFSCKDLSMMNSYRKTLMEMGQSGATLRGTLNYIDRYHPRIVLLENVWAIAKANANGFRQVDLVIQGLQARGYAAGYNLLNSCDFYLPQIRHRIWMWAVRIDEVAFNPKLTSKEVMSRAADATNKIAGQFVKILQGLEEPCALHFDDLLLDDDHPAVRKFIAFTKGQNRMDKSVMKPKRGAKRDWINKYAEHRSEHDYQFDTPYTSVRGEEFLEVLNKREKELLDLKCLDVLSEQGVDPRTFPMLWEMSQSVERVPGTRVRRDRRNYATCILPGMLWHSSRHRWVLGVEKLALQGIFAQDLRDTDFPQKLMGDLAGNAFTTSVCAANFLAALICAEDVNARKA
mmetsp:Transcript_127383/g.220833  ORF Transcript_127383/g.220833 Transcript_127383/m.220833 type:complete len:2012 (-) Transcript_127383:196-6231(-)